MAPKSPMKRHAQAPAQAKNAFNKPAAPGMDPAQHIDYAQVQAEESEVLQAIYMDDYEEVKTKGPWNTLSEKVFKLHLRASSDEDVCATLAVKLTATYPKSLPLLTIEDDRNCSPAMLCSIRTVFDTKPKELVGEVMIHEIATAILDVLEDAVQRRDAKHQKSEMAPSLEEERARTEAEAARATLEQQERDRAQEAAMREEEEKGIEDLVHRERIRQQQAKQRRERDSDRLTTVTSHAGIYQDTVDFQQRISLHSEGVDIVFSAVDRSVNIRNGPLTSVYTVQPSTAMDIATSKSTLVVKKFSGPSLSSEEKDSLFNLETELEKLKHLRHESAINVLGYVIDTTSDLSICVLTDYANKGSLQEMLEMVASVPTENVRTWTVQILEALDYYHRNGIVHGRIHANNVLLSRSLNTGATAMKLGDGGYQQQLYDTMGVNDSRSPIWRAPELSGNPSKSRKTDVWEVGIVFAEMLFGLDVSRTYVTPESMMNNLHLSESLEDLMRKFFKYDARKRLAAFDLMPSDFLRTNAPVMDNAALDHDEALASFPQALERGNRSRRGSHLGFGSTSSRYANEWVEQGRLGKGGYGEVVKARNKLDARIYAMKKVVSKSSTELSGLLSEIMLLSRLNHPYVVRYYTAWPEEEFITEASLSEGDTTATETATATDSTPSFSMKPTLDFGPSSRGLDFVSSSGFKIQFENDDSDSGDDEAITSDEDSTDTEDASALQQPLAIRRTTSSTRSRPTRTTLYIQMEFCERHTLRDLIIRELYYSPEEGWKLFRQILEGMVHIHSHGIIHRDLKPDNIFIDIAGNPRIGDFGLATSGQYQLADRVASSAATGEMTRSVGTTLYVAPELSSAGAGNYDAKVDMYSLGIIFFEMCYPLRTAMERDRVIRAVRLKDHALPNEFAELPEKVQQGQIILSLISHRPSERPNSNELLRSGKVPLQIEDDTIKEALRGLSDSSSPYHTKMMSALFAQTTESNAKDLAWELRSNTAKSDAILSPHHEQIAVEVREVLTEVFRRHGAVSLARPMLFPLSQHYTNSNAVKVFDASGTLVQLPYDLTLPLARQLARSPQTVPEKSFVIGNVFRDNYSGGAPQMNTEADFDLVSQSRQDAAFNESEVLKVMDEVVRELPSTAAALVCFHINHAKILDAIMDYCRIAKPMQALVKETISKLNIHENTWQKIRAELRAPSVGASSTSLDELARFDFRDSPERAFTRILGIVEGTVYSKSISSAVTHLRSVLATAKLMDVRSKIYFCPLASVNEKFYQGNMLFQCLFDTKRRSVLAAGGRYDSLVREYQPRAANGFAAHAVGINISVDRLVSSMERFYNNGNKRGSRKLLNKAAATDEHPRRQPRRRCDVLVTSFDPEVLQSGAVKVVADLWTNGISAELAHDARSVEGLQSRHSNDRHSWLVIVKHEKQDVKVRNLDLNEENDVALANLVSHLRAELRERASREASGGRAPRLLRHESSHTDGPLAQGVGQTKPTNQVQVLMSHHRSKKSNKWAVVEAAQARAREVLASYQNAPILAVETRDEMLEKMRETRIGDNESWRRLTQSAPLNERQYLAQILGVLEGWSRSWKASVAGDLPVDEDEAEKSRMAFVYNFRSGTCILYDLGL